MKKFLLLILFTVLGGSLYLANRMELFKDDSDQYKKFEN